MLVATRPMIRIGLLVAALLTVTAAQAAAARAPIVTVLARPVTALAASADLNGDGRQDLVASQAVGSLGGGDVIVLHGDGTGGFAAAIPFATNLSPYWITLDRLDGDRSPDLAVSTAIAVGVAFGTPSGSFGRVRQLGSVNTGGVATGDFNGDGHGDVVGSGLVSLGDGKGGFTPVETPGPSFLGPGQLTVGDFDRDLRQDVAYIRSYYAGVVVQRGHGDGTFGPPVTFPAPQPVAIAGADLDGDLDQDLLVANSGLNTVTVLLSDGRGGFVPGADVPVSGNGNPFHGAVADLNGDGALDIATSMTQAGFGALSLRFGDGRGGFPTEELIDFPTEAPDALTVGDFTGDGRCDVALSVGLSVVTSPAIYVYPGEGTPAPPGGDPCRDRVRDPVGPMSSRLLTPAVTAAAGAPVTARLSLSRPAVVGGSFARAFERTVPRRHRVLRAGRRSMRFRAPSKAGRYVLTISAGSLEGKVVRRGMRVLVRPSR